MRDEASELLARLGAYVCEACGKVGGNPSVGDMIWHLASDRAVHPCSRSCLQKVQRENVQYYEIEQTKRQQQAQADLETHRSMLRALYEPSSTEYRRALKEHEEDLREASWNMGNGLFGPIED